MRYGEEVVAYFEWIDTPVVNRARAIATAQHKFCSLHSRRSRRAIAAMRRSVPYINPELMLQMGVWWSSPLPKAYTRVTIKSALELNIGGVDLLRQTKSIILGVRLSLGFDESVGNLIVMLTMAVLFAQCSIFGSNTFALGMNFRVIQFSGLLSFLSPRPGRHG